MSNYIEFSLPSNAVAATFMSQKIKKRLIALKQENKITEFTIQLTIDYKMKVSFPDEKDITMFFLIWDNHGIFAELKLIKKDFKNE